MPGLGWQVQGLGLYAKAKNFGLKAMAKAEPNRSGQSGNF